MGVDYLIEYEHYEYDPAPVNKLDITWIIDAYGA